MLQTVELASPLLGPDGESWCRVVMPADGYVLEKELEPAPAGKGREPYLFLRAPPSAGAFAEPPCAVDADVTFTVTFNGRLGALFATLGSLLTRLSEAELSSVRSWVVVCDGGASLEQRAQVMAAFPWATVVAKGVAHHGHPASLNLILSGLVGTRWWLQWEDDWEVPTSSGLLGRAREVAEEGGFHQVSMNGAWTTGEGLEACVRGATSSGAEYGEVTLPDADRRRFNEAGVSMASLIRQYNASNMHVLPYPLRAKLQELNVQPISWPLYSNQPSLNDAAFCKSLGAFSEDPQLNPRHGEYWRFEFDFGVRFVRAGGRKATLMGGGLAEQQNVSTSSRACEPGVHF